MEPHRMAVILPQEVDFFALGITLAVFAPDLSDLPTDWYDVTLCSGSTPATIPSRAIGGFELHGLEATETADTVLVHGASPWPVEPEVLDAVARAYRRGARIVSFCTGAFVLAAAGILDGRTVTTHWKSAALLAERHPRVRVHSDVLYVDDGQVLTSAGNAAAMDLSLHIVRRDHGARLARELARDLVVPPHREGGQAQYVVTPMPEVESTAAGVQRVIEHLHHHLDEDLSLGELAGIAFMSTRHFSRRFREVTGTTPNRWILNQRLIRARELLEETDEPVERVARLSGFGSGVTMRQRFAQFLHTSPSAYRRTFRTTAPAGAPAEMTAGGPGTDVTRLVPHPDRAARAASTPATGTEERSA